MKELTDDSYFKIKDLTSYRKLSKIILEKYAFFKEYGLLEVDGIFMRTEDDSFYKMYQKI